MEREIRRAFQAVRAEEALKERAWERVQRARRKRATGRSRLTRLAAVGCCCLVLLAGGWGIYVTPTSAISFDMDPSLELEINCFGRVVSVSGYDGEGEALAQGLEVLHLEYRRAVDEILDSDAVSRCLEEDGQVFLSVVGISGGQGAEVLDYVTECTAGMGGVRCRPVEKEEAAQARQMGLPWGKYLAYLELVELGVPITPQQAGELSMSQLRALLTENGGEQGAQGHHGQGAGGYRGGKSGGG